MRIGIVLLFGHLGVLGGLQLRVETLVKGLLSRNNEVTLLQTARDAEVSRQYSQRWNEPNLRIVSVEDLSDPTPTSYARVLKKTSRAIEAEDFEIVDTYDPLLEIEFATPLVFSSTFLMPYVLDMMMHANLKLAWFHFWHAFLSRETILKASAFAVEHTQNYRILNNLCGVESDRINVIPYGYDCRILEEILAKDKVSRRPNIAFIGRITKEKGALLLANAFADLAGDFPEWSLTYIGEGPKRNSIEDFAARNGLLGRIRFAGEIPQHQVYDMLADSSVMVLDSRYEGLPSSVIQAMALGKVIISSDVGGLHADIVRDGENGLIVRRDSVRQLRRALSRVMSDGDLRTRLGESAMVSVRGMTTSNLVERTENMYKWSIEHPRR